MRGEAKRGREGGREGVGSDNDFSDIAMVMARQRCDSVREYGRNDTAFFQLPSQQLEDSYLFHKFFHHQSDAQ